MNDKQRRRWKIIEFEQSVIELIQQFVPSFYFKKRFVFLTFRRGPKIRFDFDRSRTFYLKATVTMTLWSSSMF